MALALDQIQSHVLRGYQFGQQAHAVHYLFFRFDRADAARAWLAAVAGHVTTAEETGTPTVGLGLTFPGLTMLGAGGLFPDDNADFTAFRQGMNARAPLLDDIGDSAPDSWLFGQHPLHAYVAVEGPDHAALAPRLAAIRAIAGATCVFDLPGQVRPNGREPFGFVDGISQPEIEGGPVTQPDGHGVLTPEGRWRPIKPGEFVLGYDDEDGPSDMPAPLHNGSFFVFRLLAQDVARFESFVAGAVASTGLSTDELKAKLIGRWPDGRALVQDPARPFDPATANDFRYGQDPDGFACPHGAHIRRANPRDVLEKDADRAERHRIIRRALPYQRGDEVGVCFGVVNASIERQFEFVQQRWVNAGSTSKRLGHSRDPVLGDNGGDGCLIIPGERPRIVGGLQRFVRTRGGGYFFLPGRQLLHDLTRGSSALIPAPRPPLPVPVPVAVPRRWPQLPRLTLPALGTSAAARTWVTIFPCDDPAALKVALRARKPELDARFRALGKDGRPLVHYARFAVFDQFRDEPAFGRGFLLFVCHHDGSAWSFLPALYEAFAQDPFPFDRCGGHPGRSGFLAFAWWCMRHLYKTAFGFDMYDTTVKDVVDSLAVRRLVRQLVIDTQADDAGFAARYEKFVADVARYL